jgi:hypothetical protein
MPLSKASRSTVRPTVIIRPFGGYMFAVVVRFSCLFSVVLLLPESTVTMVFVSLQYRLASVNVRFLVY